MGGKKVDVEKIKFLRKQSHLTLDEMATMLGYDSPNGYYYLERGRSKFPAETLAAVAEIFDVPLMELFFEPHEKRDKT
ncbi:MAG TPA: helix-turn-helix transcriptional regulator [Bacillales bacterium]|nr:helix-turn-helix transcriptional regulator [Bacillales bacterium]